MLSWGMLFSNKGQIGSKRVQMIQIVQNWVITGSKMVLRAKRSQKGLNGQKMGQSPMWPISLWANLPWGHSPMERNSHGASLQLGQSFRWPISWGKSPMGLLSPIGQKSLGQSHIGHSQVGPESHWARVTWGQSPTGPKSHGPKGPWSQSPIVPWSHVSKVLFVCLFVNLWFIELHTQLERVA
jgi:hypothetical protein